jgi:hypothetical protein
MPGLVPAIHARGDLIKFVDGRDKPGHDPLGFRVA